MNHDVLIILEFELGLGAGLAEKFRAVLLADSDDGQDGENEGNHGQNQHGLLPHGGVNHAKSLAALANELAHGIFLSQDGGDQHGHQGAGHLGQDAVEAGEDGALFGVVGQHGLTGLGHHGLAGVADDIDHVKQGGKQVFLVDGPVDRGVEDHDQAGPDDHVADQHVGAEFAEAAVGAVHQHAHQGIGDCVENAGARRDQPDDGRRQPQHVLGEI